MNANASILLVDDDVELLEALTKVLKKEGYEVVAQPSAINAMAYLKTAGRQFDLVITDVVMPGMTGTGFLTALKASFPAMPVILITAYGDWGNFAQAIGAGAFEYLSKPLDKAELLATVRRALSGPATAATKTET